LAVVEVAVVDVAVLVSILALLMMMMMMMMMMMVMMKLPWCFLFGVVTVAANGVLVGLRTSKDDCPKRSLANWSFL